MSRIPPRLTRVTFVSYAVPYPARPHAGVALFQLQHLIRAVEQAGNLLPLPGPITAFAFLNTLQALEDLPFDEGLRKGAQLYGCEPYLTEDRYRAKMAKGRILPADLEAVLRHDLGDHADVKIAVVTTRYELRRAMLEHALQVGPRAELEWFVAETDALDRMRAESPPEVQNRLIEETRHWVMRDLRAHVDVSGQSAGESFFADLIDRFNSASIEIWNDGMWESFTLRALWRVCCNGVQGIEPERKGVELPLRLRDIVMKRAGEDSDIAVNDVLVRFCAAFTDQGFADWTLPNRDQGFFESFCTIYSESVSPPNRWLRDLSAEVTRIVSQGLSPTDSIVESLNLLGIDEEEWDDFITASLLALRGWAGMLWHIETRSDRVPFPAPPGTLLQFLAVRLILDRVVIANIAADVLHYHGPLDELRATAGRRLPVRPVRDDAQRAFLVFQLAQLLGWLPRDLFELTRGQWSELIAEIEDFSGLERRRILHLAFERRFRVQALDALSLHVHHPPPAERPRFQAVFCLDAREESFRRHLEEVALDVQTFGAVGFYGVAMYYRGAADAHFSALCPIVIKPQHWVIEDVVYSLEEDHLRRAKTRKALGTATHQVHVRSRSFAAGALLTAGLGVLASFPLVARVLFPRLTARIRGTAGRLMQPPTVTRLRLERTTPNPGPEDDQIGYSLEEMADIGERQLRDIGLTKNFARIVFFFGHGSFCLNNPHKSAYNCGACSGNPGGANGRALAVILNDRRVREILATRGLEIPADTWFVGGLHNTGKDAISCFDLDLLPMARLHDYKSARQILDEACERNAHERCRRFESAPLELSLMAAHQHVEERCEDLAQTRPEFGNASNGMCFVGRRARVRGLFLDRRCFLTSYDPTQDDDQHTMLARVLAAAVPVCEGINLQYFLSYVDSNGWACGSKLPHNVTSLLGVMDGAASDLRPGLPWQSVEIHEPVRLLFVIETTTQAMIDIMDRDATIGRILRNGWAQLAVLDPDSTEIQIFANDEFHVYEPEADELPTAEGSVDWYRGWRDHLGFAVIGAKGKPADDE